MKTYLKIKIHTLADEARHIQREKKRWIKKDGRRDHPLRLSLHWHNRDVVRPESRAAHLAYGYLRGRKYRQMEAKCYSPPDMSRVRILVKSFGLEKDTKKVEADLKKWFEESE
jgi:hypothetical protein